MAVLVKIPVLLRLPAPIQGLWCVASLCGLLLFIQHCVSSNFAPNRAAEESENLSCETCQKEFRSGKALDAHIRNAHPDALTKAFHCTQCNTSFRFKEAMETHMENVHGVSGGELGESSSSSQFKIESIDSAIESELIEMGEGEENEEMLEEEDDPEMDEEAEGEEDDEENDKDDGEEDMEALQVNMSHCTSFSASLTVFFQNKGKWCGRL